MKTILALDLATKTGWALLRNGLVTSGVENFGGGRFEGGGMRFLRFERWLENFIDLAEPEVIFYEEVRRHMSTDASHAYGGFWSHLTKVGEKHNVPYTGLPVGTIKKLATGKGNANKQQMIDAAKLKWPEQSIKDDNQADALWILETGRRSI